MNTEQQLRHAADDMVRATAALTPPPLSELRRSARYRAAGIGVAAAVGVAILIGGAVLLLRPPGETTLAPAGPSETTLASNEPVETTSDGVTVVHVYPDLDPAPEFDLSGAREIPLLEIDSSQAGRDISQLQRYVEVEGFLPGSEFVVVGRLDGVRVFAVQGEAEALPSVPAECLFAGEGAEWRAVWCGDSISRGIDPVVAPATESTTFTIAGRAPEGASVVVLEIGEDRYWQRTRDGYVFIEVVAGDEESARFTVYDTARNRLGGHSLFAPGELTGSTTAVPVTGDESCSGARFFPETYPRSDLPEPVIQTIGQVTLFGSRCWFDDLAGVAAEFFTASFGGGDPAEIWAYDEQQGYEPMYSLMKILDMPHATVDVDGRTLYIWPAAAAHDGDWDTMPAEDKEALRSLYDDDDFADFHSFGGYIGYRTGIYEDGDWSFFVAGD